MAACNSALGKGCEMSEQMAAGSARRFPIAIRAGVAALGLLYGQLAHAELLPVEQCHQLRLQKTALESVGTRQDMEKGVEWARQNISPDRLKRVLQYIDVQEQVLFRCPPPPPPIPERADREDVVAAAMPAPPSKKARKATRRLPPIPSRRPRTANLRGGSLWPTHPRYAAKLYPPAILALESIGN
ncbi:MAG: hypothetical protein RLZ98_2150 [Pseudomonadota bacterium]|jgi:hypothetical protein